MSQLPPRQDPLPALVAICRDGAVDLATLTGASTDELAALASHHGLSALLAERAAADPALALLAAALAPAARTAAAADLCAEQALREALHALHRADVPILIFKGAQLAYTCYQRPHFRPRLDTDVLIRPADRDRAGRVLRDLGYQLEPQVDADLIMFQQMYVLGESRSPRHVIDLHWRVTNPHEFGDSFDTEALFNRAVPLPRIAESARSFGLTDALMVSLVHPVAHHGGATRAIWDFDTAALVRQMAPEDWTALQDRLHTPRLAAIAVVRLERARDWAGAPLDDAALLALRQRATPQEIAALAGVGAQPEWQTFASGLRALGGWRDRLRFVRQHVTPPATYMRDVYAPGSRTPLPALYVVRAVRGAMRWFGHGRHARRSA